MLTTFSKLKPCLINQSKTLSNTILKRNISSLQYSVYSDLTEDQIEFYESGKQFMEEYLKPNGLKYDENKSIDYNIIKKAGEIGFGGLYISESNGGTGLSRHDTTLIFEALSQGCISTTALLTIHNMSTWMIEQYGSDKLRNEYLSDMIQCNIIGSYCLTEPHSGSDAAALKTSAKLDGNEYVINGQKVFISGGGVNDVYVVMARTDNHKTKGISCFLIPKNTEGLTFGANESKMGWNGSPTTQVYFDNVRIPNYYRLGNEGDGFKIALTGLDGGRLNIGACSLGGAQRCLEDAIKYVLERQAFGKYLSEFQNIQFKMSELDMYLHSSRLMLRNAAKMFDENNDEKTWFCARAKKYVTDKCFDICNGSLQMFGGYGYLKEYEIERFVRDTRVHQILEGTNEIMQMIAARRILDRVLNNMAQGSTK